MKTRHDNVLLAGILLGSAGILAWAWIEFSSRPTEPALEFVTGASVPEDAALATATEADDAAGGTTAFSRNPPRKPPGAAASTDRRRMMDQTGSAPPRGSAAAVARTRREPARKERLPQAPASTPGAIADSATLTEVVESPEEDILAGATGFIHGLVVTAAGEPVTGASVQNLGPAVRIGTAATAVTDQQGRFLLTELPAPPAQVRLTATAQGLVAAPVIADVQSEPAAGAPVYLVLEKSGSLTVTVQDTAGQALAGAAVLIRTDSGEAVTAPGTTDAAGTVRFPQVPPGNLILTAEKTGYTPSGYGTGSGSGQKIRLQPGELVRTVLVLERTSLLNGWVVTATGAAAGHAAVYIRLFTASGLHSTTYSSPVVRCGADGSFTLRELPEGRVELSAALPGQGISAWTAVPAADESGARDLVLRFLPGYALQGRVITPGNRPVADVTVTWRPADSAYQSQADGWQVGPLAEDGRFVLQGIPAWDGVVTADAGTAGTAQAEAPAWQVAAYRTLVLVLAKAEEKILNGFITDPGSNGISGAMVAVHGTGGLRTSEVSTRPGGGFSLPLDGDGPWLVSAAAEGLAPGYWHIEPASLAGSPRSLMLNAGATLVVDVTTDLAADQIPAGTQIACRMVLRELPNAPFIFTRTATLQATTLLVMERLCPGSYQCEVSSPGLSTRSFSVMVENLPGIEQYLQAPVVMTLGATLTGTVMSADGAGIPDAAVRLDDAALPRTVSGPGGSFVLTGVPAGTVTVRAATTDRYGLSPPLQVRAGERLNVPEIRLDRALTEAGATVTYKIGLGLGWRQQEPFWIVAQVNAGSSAAAAGVRSGDRLLAVNGTSAEGWSFETLQNALGGEAGTMLDLRLERGGRQFIFRLERQVLGN